MAKKQEETLPISRQDALTKYFGTVAEIWKKKLPYECLVCHNRVMTLDKCWLHIKKNHKERLAT